MNSRASLWTVLRVVIMILRGFIQAKALKLVLPLNLFIQLYIVAHCHYHCFFAMFSGFLETVDSISFVWRLVALSFRQYRGFDLSESRQLPISRAIETNARYHLVKGLICAAFILDRRIESS